MKLLKEIRSCNICSDVLPLPPKPILQFSCASKIILIGQAPGLKAHETNLPWNDASGIRLREWLEIEEKDFYSVKTLSIVPIGFCYPGRGKSGDNPPRPECSARWMETIIFHLKDVKLKVLVGAYASSYFLGKGNFTSNIREHSVSDSGYLVLPHPSPRNNIWLSKNTWFLEQALPSIRLKFKKSLSVK